MDAAVVQRYCEIFKQRTGEESINQKGLLKLIDAVQRQRTVLSANSYYRMVLEYLMGEHDLVYDMKRQ